MPLCILRPSTDAPLRLKSFNETPAAMFQHRPHDAAFEASKKGQENRFLLPGYGRPLDFAPQEKNIYGVESRSMFPSALDDRDIENGYADMPVQTLREIGMVGFMEELTDIPEWWKKVFDSEVADKWKRDAMNSGGDITLSMANWIIDELQFKAMIYESTNIVALYNGDVTKSDTNVPASLVEDLKAAVPVLEYVEPDLQFIAPETGGKQKDLLGMALYPLVYGKSRILPNRLLRLDDALANTGKGEIIPVPKETGITREDIAWRVAARADIEIRPYSRKFQLLPSDWELGDDGKWHITTYINNLHPVKHRNIYKIMEEIFNLLIPQWNATLTPLKDMLHSRARIEYTKAEYYPVPKEIRERTPQIQPREPQSEFEERLEKWRMENFRAIQPDAGKFVPWAVPPWLVSKLPEDLPHPVRIEQGVELNKDYGDRGLQVIIRLEDINLGPEDQYWVSDWHLEGQMNEHVCASSFLMYDSVNMEDAYVDFRNMVETGTLSEVEHEPNDFIWLQQVYGLENGEPAIQPTGSIKCRVGRTIMSPSTVQHRFTRFELKDKSKPGCARFLVFYLIDPNIRIISTANIPPQRLDWTLEAQDEKEDLTTAMSRLALDNRDRKGSAPMSLNEALQYRKEALNEMVEFTRYQHVAYESKVLML